MWFYLRTRRSHNIGLLFLATILFHFLFFLVGAKCLETIAAKNVFVLRKSRERGVFKSSRSNADRLKWRSFHPCPWIKGLYLWFFICLRVFFFHFISLDLHCIEHDLLFRTVWIFLCLLPKLLPLRLIASSFLFICSLFMSAVLHQPLLSPRCADFFFFPLCL